MVKTFAAQRPSLKNLWEDVFPANEPRAKSLIEISGAPGTGKRLILKEMMARVCQTEFYGGKSGQVIFVDLSHKFDMSSFEKSLKHVMNETTVVCSQRSLENCIKYCEPIIHLPCYTPDQFELAFQDIEDLLWNHKKVSLLAIDGLDAFYWDDCYAQLQRKSTHYKKHIQRLKSLCQEHNICCAYTVDENYLQTKSTISLCYPRLQIDYKLKLTKHPDGSHYLNDKLFHVNTEGVEFNINNTFFQI